MNHTHIGYCPHTGTVDSTATMQGPLCLHQPNGEQYPTYKTFTAVAVRRRKKNVPSFELGVAGDVDRIKVFSLL